MIKYRSTTFLSLLLSYLLLGVIPSQGTIETNKGYNYYWEKSLTPNVHSVYNFGCDSNVESPGTLTYNGEENLSDAIEALNRKFRLIRGYVRELSGESIYEENILVLILDNMDFSPNRLDLRKASDMNGFDKIDPFMVDFFREKRVELPRFLNGNDRKCISAELEKKGWIVDSLLKGGRL